MHTRRYIAQSVQHAPYVDAVIEFDRDAIGKMGATPIAMTPGEFRTFLSSEIARWGKLVEMAGIQKK